MDTVIDSRFALTAMQHGSVPSLAEEIRKLLSKVKILQEEKKTIIAQKAADVTNAQREIERLRTLTEVQRGDIEALKKGVEVHKKESSRLESELAATKSSAGEVAALKASEMDLKNTISRMVGSQVSAGELDSLRLANRALTEKCARMESAGEVLRREKETLMRASQELQAAQAELDNWEVLGEEAAPAPGSKETVVNIMADVGSKA